MSNVFVPDCNEFQSIFTSMNFELSSVKIEKLIAIKHVVEKSAPSLVKNLVF